MSVIVTFGYQKARSVGGVAELLVPWDVDRIIDVRLKRYSANEEFSLRTGPNLEAAGFAYVWAPDLGNDAYKTGGVVIRRIEAIETVLLPDLRAGRTVALMCACWSARDCHRARVAAEAAERLPGVEVR